MNFTENVYEIGFVILSSVGGGALIIGGLSSWLGKVWANRTLESEKSKYTKELDAWYVCKSCGYQFQTRDCSED